jgi:hypothetical protein
MVEFVKRQAKVRNHVVFEVKSAAQPSSSNVRKDKPKQAAFIPNSQFKVTTMSTQAASEDSKQKQEDGVKPQTQCRFCKKGHHIWECAQFKQEDAQDRKRFARMNLLCYGCLGAGKHRIKRKRKKPCQSCV